MSARLCGVLAPVTTPFKADLSPDPQRFIEHCNWLLSQNAGLAVFGTNGEATSLSGGERVALLGALVDAGVDTARMMPGTGCCSLTESVELTKVAVKHGCAGVLMLPPFYYKGLSDDGLLRYFSEVIERVGDERLQVYLYHIPPVAGVSITTGLVERLLKAYPSNIAGMKDSSGEWNNTSAFLREFGAAGFDVFVGSETFLLQGMRNGAVGTISATANVNPAAIFKLYQEWKQSDADAQQKALDSTRQVFSKHLMIGALKQCIATHRKDPAWAVVRPPLVGLNSDQARSLDSELKAIGFQWYRVERPSSAGVK